METIDNLLNTLTGEQKDLLYFCIEDMLKVAPGNIPGNMKLEDLLDQLEE